MTLQFDHTIVKVNKDGHIVMGNSLSKGERLVGGDSYEDVVERVGDQTIGIPAATQTVTVEVPALTLDESFTSTVPATDLTSVEQTGVVSPDNTDPEGGSGEVLGTAHEGTSNELKGTTDDEKNSTVVEELDDADKTGERPDDDADKSTWYEFALGKGHKGEYTDITKKQLIEQYGA